MVVIQIVGGTQVRAGQPVVTIGSAADSQVAFPRDDRVEPQHAVIRQVAGRWLIESRGDALIRIGTGVPTKMGWLTRGESIKLSESGPELIFDPPETIPELVGHSPEIKRAQAIADIRPATEIRAETAPAAPVAAIPSRHRVMTARATSQPTTPSLRTARNRQILWVLAGGALLAAGLALGSFWSGPSGGGRSDSAATDAGDSTKVAEGRRADPGDPGSRPESRENLPSGNPDRSGNSDRIGRRGEITADRRQNHPPDAGVCLVIVKLPEGEQVFQLGTAFAMAPGRLVTSGAVAVELRGHQSRSRTGWARSISADSDFEIASIRAHPEYIKAVEQAHELHQEDETLRDKITRGEAGDDRDALARALTDIDERLIAAYERQVSFDIAVLELTGSSPELPALAAAGRSPPAGARLSVWGLPFGKNGDVFVDPERMARVVHASATVLLRSNPANDRALARLVVRCQENLAGQNWSGSALVNSTGHVVGVYSRPTPPPVEGTDRPPPETHDIVEIEKLQEFVPELKTRN